MKASETLAEAVEALKASTAIDHWQASRERYEAEYLLSFANGGEELAPGDEVPPAVRTRFVRMVTRRATGEPVPYITGVAEFRGLELTVRPGVFVPRDSTEFLAEQAARRLRGRRSPVLVDLATGGGPVALAVANEVPTAQVLGTDVSVEAIRLARRNADRFGLAARFVVGDLFGGLPEELRSAVDVITLHPPYVARNELRHLPHEIRGFEPVHTLTDRSLDGLGLIERTASEAGAWLLRGGWLLIEVSPDRANAVRGVLRDHGFRDVRSTKGGVLKVTRVVVGRW